MVDADLKNVRAKKEITKNKSETNLTASGYTKASDNANIMLRYPRKIIKISSRLKECNSLNRIHPTQKPVELFEYLIKTYTNEGDLVLDNTAGSGTTAVACLNTNRQFIVMEKDETYFNIIKQRVNTIKSQINLF